jgi:hypothetical protein
VLTRLPAAPGGHWASSFPTSGRRRAGVIRRIGDNRSSVIGRNTYTTADTYTVRITVRDRNGGTTTVTTTITVAQPARTTPTAGGDGPGGCRPRGGHGPGPSGRRAANRQQPGSAWRAHGGCPA